MTPHIGNLKYLKKIFWGNYCKMFFFKSYEFGSLLVNSSVVAPCAGAAGGEEESEQGENKYQLGR